MKKPATIRDIARAAGVSVATVSHVLNGVAKVSEATRLRVQATMAAMDYQPDFTARSLARQRSGLIGLVLPAATADADALGFNPFYTDFIAAVEGACARRGFDLILTALPADTSCQTWVQKRHIEGVIFLGEPTAASREALHARGVPVTLVDAHMPLDSPCLQVGIDDEAGGYLATRHLLELGHRAIAFAAGPRTHGQVNLQRYLGYLRAHAEAGVAPDSSLALETEVSFEGGLAVAATLADRGWPATALFAAADILAFGVLRAARAHGRQVPGELSVVGFDDLAACRYVAPALTTVHQGIPAKGEAAAELTIQALSGTGPARVVLPLELVVRESTGPVTRS